MPKSRSRRKSHKSRRKSHKSHRKSHKRKSHHKSRSKIYMDIPDNMRNDVHTLRRIERNFPLKTHMVNSIKRKYPSFRYRIHRKK